MIQTFDYTFTGVAEAENYNNAAFTETRFDFAGRGYDVFYPELLFEFHEQHSIHRSAGNSNEDGLPFSGVREYTVPIVFGERIQFCYGIRALSYTGWEDFPHTDLAIAEFNSARWGGMMDARTALGEPVQFTVLSESGINWAQPVPEPSTGAIAAVVFAILMCLRRLRRQLAVSN
jgi:hypothetical protein